MNPSQETNEVRIMNKVIVGTLLLFVIVGSGMYGTMKFVEVYNILAAPVNTPVATRLDNEEKDALLDSVSKLSVSDIEEKDKLSVLTALVSQENVKIKDRENILDSLR